MKRTKKRITENAVLVDNNGNICAVTLTSDAENPRKKTRSFYRISDNSPVDAKDVHPIEITDFNSLSQFVIAFNNLPIEPRGGYDSYYNNFGPTNPKSCNDLVLQGQLKMVAIFITSIIKRIAKNNGADTEDAKKALSLIKEFVDYSVGNITLEKAIDTSNTVPNTIVNEVVVNETQNV